MIMNVGELIKELNKFPPELRVSMLIRDYLVGKGFTSEIKKIDLIEVQEENSKWIEITGECDYCNGRFSFILEEKNNP